MTTISEQLQQVKTYFETRNYGMLMRVVNQASGFSRQKVQDELEIQIENLKNEAIKQFDQERYNECLKSFQFLTELDPQNRQFGDYLELCREMLDEKEPGPSRAILANAYKNFAEADFELKKSSADETKVLEHDEVIYEGSSSAVSSPSGKSMVDSQALSRVNIPAGHQKPGWAILLLKRAVRVSALVAGMLLFFAMLNHWTQRVRAPHLPDRSEVEPVQREFSEREQRGLPNAKKKMTPKDKPIESADSAVQETPSPVDSTQEESQLTETYPVVHEHVLGSCRGELKLSPHSIAFAPIENFGDAFKHSPADIIEIDFGRTLKIRFIDRTYRFTANSAGSKRINRAKLKRIYSQLIKLRRETQ